MMPAISRRNLLISTAATAACAAMPAAAAIAAVETARLRRTDLMSDRSAPTYLDDVYDDTMTPLQNLANAHRVRAAWVEQDGLVASFPIVFPKLAALLADSENGRRLMPAATATTAVPGRHHWHMQFDRVTCRDCGVEHTDEDDNDLCTRAAKIRPIAGFRQQPTEGRA